MDLAALNSNLIIYWNWLFTYLGYLKTYYYEPPLELHENSLEQRRKRIKKTDFFPIKSLDEEGQNFVRMSYACTPVLLINEPTKMGLALDFWFKVNTSKYSKKPLVFFC